MKAVYEIIGLTVFFLMTVLIVIFSPENIFTQMWIPIYYMIGVMLYFIGRYNGVEDCRSRDF